MFIFKYILIGIFVTKFASLIQDALYTREELAERKKALSQISKKWHYALFAVRVVIWPLFAIGTTISLCVQAKQLAEEDAKETG